MKNVNDFIVKKIKEKRGSLKLNQDSIANFLGISRPSYVNLEKGKHSISCVNLYKLCSLFNETPNYFFPVNFYARIYEEEKSNTFVTKRTVLKIETVV